MMLERFGDRFATVVELVADSGGHPVAFFCAGGKNRTGLVAALVLGALGVADETIAADYAHGGDPPGAPRTQPRTRRGPRRLG
jgi:protein-tyrosine phosphatase